MAKGPFITDEVKRLIANVYLQHRDWRAKEIQREVDQQLNGNGPGLSAVQKILAKIRDKEGRSLNTESGLDAPWSLGSLGMKPEYELPPEIIPTVLDLKRARELENKRIYPERIAEVHRRFKVEELEKLPGWVVKFDRSPPPFSVREAKWVARISRVLPDRVTTEEIGVWARLYADFEKACELAGIRCNTTSLDIGLSAGDLWAYFMWILFPHTPGLAQRCAQDIETKLFGNTLSDIEFTPLAWSLYYVWLQGFIDLAKKWTSLSIKKREETVKRLRAWVLEQEPVEDLKRPDSLLEEIQYTGLFGETQGNPDKWAKEVRQ